MARRANPAGRCFHRRRPAGLLSNRYRIHDVRFDLSTKFRITRWRKFRGGLRKSSPLPVSADGARPRAVRKCADIVAHHIDSGTEILRGLGFDDVGIAIYRSAALTAFRAARPSI